MISCRHTDTINEIDFLKYIVIIAELMVSLNEGQDTLGIFYASFTREETSVTSCLCSCIPCT